MTERLTGFDADFSFRVSRLIRNRRTTKVLVRPGQSVDQVPNPQCCNQLVREAVADAGFAPFHFHRNIDSLAEPWRFHILWQDECRYIGRNLDQWFADANPGNKLSAMLLACGSLVLVNWLPQSDGQTPSEKQLQINEEHLAATAAATQTLLLKLTACNLGTYWSSGGFFRRPEMFTRLSIPLHEKLLAAVFVDYCSNGDQVERIAGNHVSSRSDYRAWTREIRLAGSTGESQ